MLERWVTRLPAIASEALRAMRTSVGAHVRTRGSPTFHAFFGPVTTSSSNHATRPELPPRSDRLRPPPGTRELAGPSAYRGAIRAELRRGRRELRAAWRPRVRAVPVGDRRRGRVPVAPYEHGVDLRI